jgi:hypothetical protein
MLSLYVFRLYSGSSGPLLTVPSFGYTGIETAEFQSQGKFRDACRSSFVLSASNGFSLSSRFSNVVCAREDRVLQQRLKGV